MEAKNGCSNGTSAKFFCAGLQFLFKKLGDAGAQKASWENDPCLGAMRRKMRVSLPLFSFLSLR
jgi:hypothetical protein